MRGEQAIGAAARQCKEPGRRMFRDDELVGGVGQMRNAVHTAPQPTAVQRATDRCTKPLTTPRAHKLGVRSCLRSRGDAWRASWHPRSVKGHAARGMRHKNVCLGDACSGSALGAAAAAVAAAS